MPACVRDRGTLKEKWSLLSVYEKTNCELAQGRVYFLQGVDY